MQILINIHFFVSFLLLSITFIAMKIKGNFLGKEEDILSFILFCCCPIVNIYALVSAIYKELK